MSSKPSLLILVHWYHPGFRAGGLIQATYKMVKALENHYQIFILSTNTDFGIKEPYPNIEANCWTKNTENIQVKYLDSQQLSYKNIKKEILAIQPEVLYVKGMFDPLFNVYPLWLKYKDQIRSKVIVAPSGMLMQSALKAKYWKKAPFIWLMEKSGLGAKVNWHVTDNEEQQFIKNHFSPDDQIFLLENFPPFFNNNLTKIEKSESLSILFLSRIHPIKNLSFLLELLEKVSSSITLTIAGPVEDEGYYKECCRRINKLPENIQVKWLGLIPPEEITTLLQQHHLFVLPTKGENYGYAIIEALAAGRPVLISDQTPWKDLEAHNAGWDLSLEQPEAFIKAIEKIAAMDQTIYDSYCENALSYAKKINSTADLVEGYKKMFKCIY